MRPADIEVVELEVDGRVWRIEHVAGQVWAALKSGAITEAEVPQLRDRLRAALGYGPLDTQH